MKVSYPWLLKFVGLDSLAIDVEVIAKTLTMIGLNVEEILWAGALRAPTCNSFVMLRPVGLAKRPL